jgi:hypothetical protein
VRFVLMLTRDDRTVPDCLEVYAHARDLDVRHVGIKDIGAPVETMRELVRRVRADGGTSYLEVVSLDHETALAAARTAVSIGVDRLLGGTDAPAMLAAVAGSGIAYHPFAGRPFGHPTRLGGTADDVARDCRRFADLGVAGVDLLAFRATEADPVALVRAARAATPGTLVVAGSVNSPERVRAAREAGADAVTVGSAALEGTFARGKPGLREQLREILAACA